MAEQDVTRAVGALERAADALERVAAANERLNDLATTEAQEAPREEDLFDAPACPHCGTLDPHTRQPGGEGRLSEYVMATPCGTCGSAFYAIPVGWRIVGSKEEARDLLELGAAMIERSRPE